MNIVFLGTTPWQSTNIQMFQGGKNIGDEKIMEDIWSQTVSWMVRNHDVIERF